MVHTRVMNSPTRGRPKGSRSALKPSAEARLLKELRDGEGPVSLAAVARKFVISRETVHSYVAADPAIQEAIRRRREEFGRGYVQGLRGTPESRAEALGRVAQAVAQAKLPPPTRAQVLAALLPDIGGRMYDPELDELTPEEDAAKAALIGARVSAEIRASREAQKRAPKHPLSPEFQAMADRHEQEKRAFAEWLRQRHRHTN